jgi:hypothetical protein
VKIRSVRFDNRRQAFLVSAAGKTYEMPYAAMDRRRGRRRMVRAFVDPELGREAFTFETGDGEVGAVHIDNVLLHGGDPRAERDDTLYRLTLAAEEALIESGVGKRALARRVGTSMSQLARLLDATNRTKSIEQMMTLLRALGRDVEVVVRRRRPGTAA